MPHTQATGSSPALQTNNVQPVQVKRLNIRTRLLRYLGFSSVTLVEGKKYIPSPSKPRLSFEQSERTIVKLGATFQGFRANKQTLKKLEQRLMQAPELQQGRSAQNREAKIRLAMVAAGMATLTSTDPVTVTSSTRRLLNPELKAKQFETLSHWLDVSDNELIKHIDPEICLTFPLEHLDPVDLSEQAMVININHPVDRTIMFRHCRDYCLYGEGKQLFKQLKVPVANIAHDLLPPPESCEDNETITRNFRGTRSHTDPTPTSELQVRTDLAMHNISLKTPLVINHFDPANRSMRALVIMGELFSCYRATLAAKKNASVEDPNADEDAMIKKYDLLLLQSSDTLTALSQSVMKDLYPQHFSNDYYQQVVLERQDMPGTYVWNSDSRQPRHGWLDIKDASYCRHDEILERIRADKAGPE